MLLVMSQATTPITYSPPLAVNYANRTGGEVVRRGVTALQCTVDDADVGHQLLADGVDTSPVGMPLAAMLMTRPSKGGVVAVGGVAATLQAFLEANPDMDDVKLQAQLQHIEPEGNYIIIVEPIGNNELFVATKATGILVNDAVLVRQASTMVSRSLSLTAACSCTTFCNCIYTPPCCTHACMRSQCMDCQLLHSVRVCMHHPACTTHSVCYTHACSCTTQSATLMHAAAPRTLSATLMQCELDQCARQRHVYRLCSCTTHSVCYTHARSCTTHSAALMHVASCTLHAPCTHACS
jgi:hypothetical protein